MMAARAQARPGRVSAQEPPEDGRPQATGTLMKDAAIAAVLDRVACA